MWSDESFASIAGVIESGCVLAGVRSASVGMPVEVTATAPFTAGRWLFGHNGFVPDGSVLRDLLPPGVVPESRVDSALLWTLVLARLEAGASPAEAVADVVTAVSARAPGRMNLFLTDGESLVASAWGDTLWVRETAAGVLVASEPDSAGDSEVGDLENHNGWHELHDRTLLIVEQGRISTSALGGALQEGAA
jgi:glutamine amidotransferase